MIWVWAIAGFILSLMFVRKKNIRFHHFIWALLPIDMYGITFSSAIIKPYMIFALIILIINISKFRGNLKLIKIKPEWFIGIVFLFCMMLLSDMVNGSGLASIRQHFMFFIVFICGWVYISCIENEGEIEQVKDILIGTSIGYGLIYLLALLINQMNIDFAGVSTWIREQPGLILKFIDIPDGRLRGFLFDPNLVVTSFLPSIAISINNLFTSVERRLKTIYIFQIIISLICIYFTKSRMALISSFIIIGFSMVSGLKHANANKKRRFFSFVIVALSLLMIVTFLFPDSILGGTFSSLFQQYEGRSPFSGQYGRGMLWQSAWNILVNNNLMWGIGQGQVRYYGERDCHNTWLEWIVGSGLITGILVILYFISIYIKFSFGCERQRRVGGNIATWYGIKWGYLGIAISLLSVDNITNSNLIFLASIMMLLLNTKKLNKELENADLSAGTY